MLNMMQKPLVTKRNKNFISWCTPRKVKGINSDETTKENLMISSTGKIKAKLRTKDRGRMQKRLKHIEHLACPKTVKSSVQDKRNPFKIKKGALRYKASVRTTTLAQSKKNNGDQVQLTMPRKLPFANHSLEYFSKLAEPRIHDSYLPSLPRRIKERTLLAKASKRIKELATPKTHLISNNLKKGQDPFQVSPFALKATCSPRMQMLAKPRGFII